MIKLSLQSIKNSLRDNGLESSILNRSEEYPLDYLFVYLDSDSQDRDWTLQICLLKQTVQEEEYEEESFYHLQLLLPLPFEVQKEHFPNLARLILKINKTCSVAGFELSEEDNLLFFRNVHLVKGEWVCPDLLLSLINYITDLMKNFSSLLEASAEGHYSFEQSLKEIEKIQLL